MPAKTTQMTTSDDAKRRAFSPIRRDLLERLTRECDSKSGDHWHEPVASGQTATLRKFRQR